MRGAISYNHQLQLQQLHNNQRKNDPPMSGQGALPSKSTDWLNPDFRGQMLGKITDLGQFAELFGAGPRDFAGAIAIEGTLNARERKLGGFLTASGNSLSLFKRQIDRLSAKINLKADAFELEQFELVRKKDFIRAQGKIDISRDNDYSGSIEAKVGDASDYFLLGRSGSGGAAIPMQLNAKISSGSWDTQGAFTLPGSSPVDLVAKFSLKIGQDWKTFLASPLAAMIHFPALVLASAPQFLHPAIFNEGILSGTISISQNLEHPNITGEVQLLNGVLQNAPLDLTRASGRLTFDGDHGALEFLSAASKDVDLSLKGELDFRNTKDAVARISSATPLFDTSANVQDCVRRIEIVPVDVTLAPTIEQIEFQGDVFGNTWKFALKEKEMAAITDQSAREFHFCTGATPRSEVLNIGVHPRPQPSPSRARKGGRRR